MIGAGLAGCLAAHVLADRADEVVLVESDTVPPDARPRGGVPQDRQAHMLLPGGQRALDTLLPGIIDELVDAGAVLVRVPDDIRLLTPAGWLACSPAPRILLTCTRPLIDCAVRERVLANPRITITQSTTVTGLRGGAGVVHGVLVRKRGFPRDHRVLDLTADFVVDAAGRRSGAVDWLDRLGCPRPPSDWVDSGITYATRMYQPPSGVRINALLLQSKPPETARLGLILPAENGRWIVGIAGLRGYEPPTDEDGFLDFAARLRDPIMRDLLARARPIGPIRGFRPQPSRRLRVDRRTHWPDGFVVLGDAMCTFNPVYGQGMSVAAISALTLRAILDRHGLEPGVAPRAQRALARTTNMPWRMAAIEDARYPLTKGGPTGPMARFQHRVLDRLVRHARTDAAVAGVYLDVISLTAPPTTLLTPKVLWRLLRSERTKSDPVTIAPWLMKILACPRCHGALAAEEDELVCTGECRSAYPVRERVPALVTEHGTGTGGVTRIIHSGAVPSGMGRRLRMVLASLRKEPDQVAARFDEVAGRYDLTNAILSFGQGHRWHRIVRQLLDLRPGELCLDLAAGTGVSTEALARSGASVVGVDISLGMIQRRQRRNVPLTGDALALPFADGSFDAVTVSFGLRNVVDTGAALRELARVTRPGGRMVVCEFSQPTNHVFRHVYLGYLMRLLPGIARQVFNNPGAYGYLSETIRGWPDQETLATMIAQEGWDRPKWRNLSGGTIAVHKATRR